MKENNRHILLLAMLTIFLTAILFMPWPLIAGPLEPPANAVDEFGNPVPTMRTLSDIFLFTANISACSDVPQRVRFVKNEDGTVTDCYTGLMWDENAWRFYFTTSWNTAVDSCSNSTTGGYDDWQLPEIEHLETLVDCSYGVPCLSNTLGTDVWEEKDPFINVKYGGTNGYWSNTPTGEGYFGCSEGTVYSLNFETGYIGKKCKNSSSGLTSAPIWCVREP